MGNIECNERFWTIVLHKTTLCLAFLGKFRFPQKSFFKIWANPGNVFVFIFVLL